MRLSLVVALLVSSSAFAGSPEALNWLLNHQSPDGTFGAQTAEDQVVATSEALDAFNSLGLTDTSETTYARSALSALPRSVDSELLLRRALARSAADSFTFDGALTGHAQGFAADDSLDLALALRATAGLLSSTERTALASSLISRARATGCHGWADDSDSPELTAQVLLGLRSASFAPNATLAITGAASCLLTLQQPDGSWGSVSATALSVIALAGAPVDASVGISRARAFLAALQAADGSWGGSVRATSLAVRALATSAPDWRIALDELGRPAVTFSNPDPLRGETVNAVVVIQNVSSAPAPAVLVRAVASSSAGDVIVGETFAPPLAAGASASVTVSVDTRALSGTTLVRILVDPNGVVGELDEFNNEARGTLQVRSGGDLLVTSGSIRFAPQGAQVSVAVDVRNLGETLASTATVNVYRGNPQSGGVLIGSGAIAPGLGVNQSATVSVLWSPTTSTGPTPIFAVVDPANTISEADETNNTAFRYYFGGAEASVDLSVNAAELIIGATPTVGVPFDARVTVRNNSSTDANRVPVAIFDNGTPRVLYGQTELAFVPANGSAEAVVRLTLRSTSNVVVLVVDPDQTLNDPNRANNASTTVVSAKDSGFNLVAGALSTNTPSAQDGQSLSVAFQVTAVGSAATTSRLTLVDIADGTNWADRLLALRANESTTLTLGPFTTPARPAVLRACVDVDSALDETNENDNCATLTVGRGSTNLSVHPRDLRAAPTGAAVGEKVRLSAVVRNSTATAATAAVEWWHGNPLEAAGRLVGSTSISVPANGTTLAELDWVRADGPVEFFVRVVNVVPKELDPANNLSGRHLFLEEIVDLGLGTTRIVQEPEVRLGDLTGDGQPELVVGYFTPSEGGVAMLQNVDGRFNLVWRRAGSDALVDVALADLDRDGAGEVVLVTAQRTPPYSRQIDVIRADGSLKWQRLLPSDGQLSSNNSGHIALGDVDGDGTTDLVLQQNSVVVVSGVAGATLWSTPVATSFAETANVTVLDTDGDGTAEVLSANTQLTLLDHLGNVRWQTGGVGTAYSIVDADLDGTPDLVTPSGCGVRVTSLQTGGLIAQTSQPCIRGWEFADPSAGATRQDGLAYPALGDNSFLGNTMSYRPDSTLLWLGSQTGTSDVYATTLADVVGLGRPQVIAHSSTRSFILQDGRDGRALLQAPHVAVANLSNFVFFQRVAPVVAGARADGRARILSGMMGDSLDTWSPDGSPMYGQGVLVFTSSHWTQLPGLWPARTHVARRVDAQLKWNTAYRWWTDHNTWNQQFADAPSRLLADLELRDGGLVASASPTVGQSSTLTATVRNVGGVVATNASVTFFDGEPDAGVWLGDAVVASPLAARTGVGTATLAWTPPTEGEHRIVAVANRGGAIEESGLENNSTSTRVFVRPADQACDLALDPSLSAVPAAPLAGESFALQAVVRNLGAVGCSASSLSASDGSQVTTASIPALAAGAAASVPVTLVARPGSQRVLLTIAVADANTANNSATFDLFVPASTAPDLVALSVEVTASLAPGLPASAALTVRNVGASAPASSAVVRLGSQGVRVALPPLLSGEVTTASVQLTAPPPGTWLLSADVDTPSQLAEFNESNNHVETTVEVSDPGFTLATTLTPSTVGSFSSVQATTFVQTASLGHALTLTRQLVDAQQSVIATLPSDTAVVSAASSATASTTWNSGQTAPGTYELVVTALEGSIPVSRSRVPLTVTASPAASLALVTDRGSYEAGRTALFTVALANLSGNLALPSSALTLEVLDPLGAVVLTEVRALGVVGVDARLVFGSSFELSPSARTGAWAVRATFASAGVVLNSQTTAFTVTASPGGQLVGALQVPPSFVVGLPLEVDLELTNPTSVALAGQLFTVELVDPASASPVSQSTGAQVVSLAAGERRVVHFSLPTAGLSPGRRFVLARTSGRVLDTAVTDAQPFVDVEPPVVTISGVVDGEFRAGSVTPLITVTDASSFTSVATLDGASFSGATISSEGAHVLVVAAQDVFGNRTETTVRFTIDTTPPVLTLSGVNDGDVTRGPVTLVFSASDLNLDRVTSTLDGNAVASGTSIATEGEHTWVVTALDLAGNATTARRVFSIDLTAPAITITGPAEGSFTNTPATLSWAATDAHLASVVATLDGAVTTSPAVVSLEGHHVLEVSATDVAGNTSVATRAFTLDFTSPVVVLTGVTNGAVVRGPVTLHFAATDASLATAVATLDGQPFSDGATVTTEGTHLATVVATDRAGNSTTRQLSFTIDTTGPVIQVAGVTDGLISRVALTITWSPTDAHLATATLDGAGFTSGTTVSTDGAHVLRVDASDAAGNTSTRVISFTIDRTPPLITITGVTSGASGTSFTPFITVADATTAATFASTLDGAPFTSGTLVNAPGAHVLNVDARDAAGNTASATVSFTVTNAGGTCMDRTTRASRSYSPSKWHDRLVSFTPPVALAVPWTLDVTRGNAGNGRAYLFFQLASGRSERCTYEGGASRSHPTRPADVAAGLRYQLKSCSTVSGGARLTVTSVRVHVHSGDSRAGETEVSWRMQELQPCVGATATERELDGHRGHDVGDDDDGRCEDDAEGDR